MAIKFGNLVVDEPSASTAQKIEEISPEKFKAVGNDGMGLRVSTSLDEMVMQFRNLKYKRRRRFRLALYWWDMASRCGNISAYSLSFAALVSSVEALAGRGETHHFKCPECGGSCQHEVPGATERFKTFLEKFASGDESRQQRSKMYALRSTILHGSDLMELDHGTAFGWDPPTDNEISLHRELSALVRDALRNWLATSPDVEGDTSND